MRGAGAPAAGGLARAARAYSSLGAALLQAGVLPFPADETALAGRRAALAQAPAAWQPSSSSDGRPVWQLEQALTVLCRRDGGVERWIFLLEGRKALRDRGVAAALERIAALDEAAQRPTGAIAAPVPGLVAAPFYYEYAAQGRIWRFTPHFTRGRCSRIDVEELPGRGSGRSAR